MDQVINLIRFSDIIDKFVVQSSTNGNEIE